MVDQAERKVFDMVEQGKISAEEALRLINALKSGEKTAEEPVYSDTAEAEAIELDSPQVAEEVFVPETSDLKEPQSPQIPEEEIKRMKQLKRWWVLPFGIGLLIMTMGAIWMFMGYNAAGFGWGFWLAWLPFLLGIGIIVISFQSSRSVWIHVRIHQSPGERPERIVISLPLPLNLARWVLRTFGDKIPGVKDQPVQEYASILENLSPEAPFYVHVQEDDGEEVEVFIG